MIYNFQKAETIYIPSNQVKNSTDNLKEFIIENFEIPDNDLDRICEFIRQDYELEKILYQLPDLIRTVR